MSNAAALSVQDAADEVLLISTSSEINGTIISDTVVAKNCTLHVRGNMRGNLTIEAGAKVVVEGSVDGKITNKGGRLIVNNKGLAECVSVDGPLESEACGVLKINLTAIAFNWDALLKRTEAECAAVLKGNAYGCGIDPIAAALSKSGCRTFFVSNIPEARRVRAVSPSSIIYVLNGLYSGALSAFAEINARPVINSLIEMAEWDVFVTSNKWDGGCALNVDTGASRLGISMEEAAAFAPKVQSLNHGVGLLMSRLDHPDYPGHPVHERQIANFRDLRRLYDGIPASLASSSGIFTDPKIHYDLVRAGGVLYGINPVPGADNPMIPVLELKARIVQVRNLAPGETIAETGGWTAKRPSRIALVSVGYADGYPRPGTNGDDTINVMVGGQRCPVVGNPAMDFLPVDVTDLSDPAAARYGEMVTLIGGDIGVDDLAVGGISAREVLSHLGNRFHRFYYAI